MDTKDYLKKIENLEIENLKVHRYGKSFDVYPWFKSRWFHKVSMGSDVLQEKNALVFIAQMKSIFYGFFNFFRKYDAWAFTNSSERTLIDSKFKDRLFDPISEQSKLKVLLVELRLFKKYKRKDVASKYVVSRSLLLFIEEIYLRIFLRNVKLEGQEIYSEIEQILGVEVDHKQIIRKYLAQYRVMKILLKVVPNPKNIFLSVSYANFGYIQAWKESGIKVIEFQHGLIGEQHYGYLYLKKLNPIQFPDEIIVFGKRDRVFFESKTVIPIKKAHALGRYIIDYYSKFSLVNGKEIKSISVSLQDGDYSFALLDFIFKCDANLQHKVNWLIQTRRTPASEYQKKYSFPSNMQFHEGSIYEAITKTDAHITIFSTTSIEALALGKICFLYDFKKEASTHLKSLLNDNKYAYFIASEVDFLERFRTYKYVNLSQVQQVNTENIEVGFSQNLNTYLKLLINENF